MILRSNFIKSRIRPWVRFNHTPPIPFYFNQKTYIPSNQEAEELNELSNGYIQPQPKNSDHVIIAMSSGVDSSVCAALFKDYPKVRGLYMANWNQNSVCVERDWIDVQKICKKLNIPVERVNFEFEYWTNVFEPMIEKYKNGLTPNPDINCNKYVKFGKLVNYLDSKYENYKLVTGHYARIMKKDDEFQLLRGSSTRKDQSYYLSTIPKDCLNKLILPIGHFTKREVRKMAKEFKLENYNKKDSQGLCFVNPDQKNFRQFLNEYLESNPGNIITEDGRIWGKHQGLWHATIGQRSSVSMPQGNPDFTGVWYVSEKRPLTNEIVIVKGHDNPKLYKDKIEIGDLHLFYSIDEVLNMDSLSFQYSSLTKPTNIKSIRENGDGKLIVKLVEPARAVTPGQGGVLYRDNQVIGCGMIM
ncbi:unnamed protein product [Candida verbasci]|uniref:tRNA-5-taurinomethyluridine 2-sulfurtransferase n=1 Tax=Candida verbasci TaxID=1227364 RepID=A0A9W4TTR0_9ASCO|nr:unnamed protein product [Candida verbasci]